MSTSNTPTTNTLAKKSTTQRAFATVAAGLALAGAFAMPAHAQSSAAKQPDNALTRAEVVADLVLWRRAGVDLFEASKPASMATEAYRKAYEEYLRLRNSEQFQLEVQKVTAGK